MHVARNDSETYFSGWQTVTLCVCACVYTSTHAHARQYEEREVLDCSETSYSLDEDRHCPQALIQVNFHILSYNSEVRGCDRRIRFHTSPW